MLGHDALEHVHELLEIRGGKIGVRRRAARHLHRVDRVLEQVALGVEHDLAEHLDEPAVAVPREALVTGLGDQPGYGALVEPEVEDRVHHARHGKRGPGAHGHEQRVGFVAEALAHLGLEGGNVRCDLLGEALGKGGRRGVVILHARLTGDGEAWRDRKSHGGHLGQVGALATEDELHALVALGLSAAECVYALGIRQLRSSLVTRPTPLDFESYRTGGSCRPPRDS